MLTAGRNILQLDSIAKRILCCISMEALNTFILFTVTSTPSAIRKECNVRFHVISGYTNAPQCNVARTLSCLRFVVNTRRLVLNDVLSTKKDYNRRHQQRSALSTAHPAQVLSVYFPPEEGDGSNLRNVYISLSSGQCPHYHL